MNKQQLVHLVSTKTGLSKTDVRLALDSITATIKMAVLDGRDVNIRHFGTFTKNKRRARVARNPHTGKIMKVASKWHPKFKPHEDFKNKLNKGTKLVSADGKQFTYV